MEFYDGDFMDELLGLQRETNPIQEENQIFSNMWSSFDCYDQNSCCSQQEVPQSYYSNSTFSEIYGSLLDESATPQFHDLKLDTPQFLGQEDFPILSMMEELEDPGMLEEEIQNMELQNKCKMEEPTVTQSPEMAVAFNSGSGREKTNRAKKVQGQPSKNLMAERRRRKRLNERLSMLRAIVPKISKMDRTSILGDTIDYMKELLEKINNLQLQQEIELDSKIVKNVKPNETLTRNSPKFEVERSVDTRVEICCAGKPGLLLSTVNTLEALGLEIQQCVISCFSDFTMQASCSEELERRTMVSSEDIKQALFKSAGYGGRCL